MGYSIRQIDGDIFIDQKLKKEAKKALELYNNEKFNTLEHALEFNRFGEIKTDENENIISLTFTGEYHSDVDKVLSTIAPFIKEGCYMEFSGDENSLWRWYFRNKKIEQIRPVITWNE